MQRKEKEKEKPNANKHRKLLDWKLDFRDDELSKDFKKSLNQQFVSYFRVGLFMLIGFIAVSTLLPYFLLRSKGFNDTTLSDIFGYIVPNVAWCLLFVVLLHWDKMKLKSIYLGVICLIGICISYIIADILGTKAQETDPDAYYLVSLILLFFALIRLPIKAAFPVLLIPISMHAARIIVIMTTHPWYYRMALMQATGISFIVGTFSGYLLEKRMKHDFVRTKVAEIESEKLSDAIGRDISLLRNIFPKNLSDELEIQLSRNTARRATSSNNLKRTYTKNSAVNDVNNGMSTEVSKNPLVRIISSFNSRESAGWRALQNISPPDSDGSQISSSRDNITQSSASSSHIELISPRNDRSDSTFSTPRMDPTTFRIDASTPRSSNGKIDTPLSSNNQNEVDMPNIEITIDNPHTETGISYSPTTGDGRNHTGLPLPIVTRGRSNSVNTKTPRNVVPIYRQDSQWHSLTSLPTFTPIATTNGSPISPRPNGNANGSFVSIVESPRSGDSTSPPSPARTIRALIPPLRIPNPEPFANSPTSPLSRSLPGIYPISPTRHSPHSGRRSRARNYTLNNSDGSITTPVSPATHTFNSAGSYSSSSVVSRESSLVSLNSFSPPATPLATSSSNSGHTTSRTNVSNSSGYSSNSSGNSSSSSGNSSSSSGNSKGSKSADTSYINNSIEGEHKGRGGLSVVIPSSSSVESMTLSPVSHSAISPTAVYNLPPIVFVPPSPMGTPTEPPVTSGMPPRYLTSSGKPLHTHHGPELYTFFNGAKHADGSLIALSHSYSDVTVVLVDIVGFTSLSSTISPQELVDILNTIFSMFDDIMEEYHLEKIRTIGDAYLCVGNMSIPLEDHQNMALEAAYRMLEVVTRIEKQSLTLRVGIASGPLIAGVTGTMKWNYDIFGTPLADATLMETSSPPGHISVTRSIFEACQDNPYFTFEMKEVEGDDDCMERYQVTPTNALTTTTSEIKLNIILRYNDPLLSTELLDKYAVDVHSTHLSAKMLDYMDTDTSSSDIPLTDMTLTADHPIPTYSLSKEELEHEIGRTSWKKVLWRTFKNPAFEDLYQTSRLEKTKPFMARYSYLLIFTVIVYSLVDLASDDFQFKIWSIYFLHFVQAIVVVLLIYLIHSHYEREITEWVTLGALGMLGLCVLIQIGLQPTIFHVHRTPVIICTLSLCFRVKPYKILIPLTAYTIVGGTETLIYPVDESNEVGVFLFHFFVLIISVATQMFIEKSFRTEFLVRKLIDVNVIQHKHSQHRAKLLLHNILPQQIIPKLQKTASRFGPQGIVDLFEDATIMFVNIVNLDELTADLNAADTFNLYNEIFTQFDEATHNFGLEKIKTINSVYMVAAGLPRKTPTHCEDALNLAHELHAIARSFAVPPLMAQIRIGVACGPVVAGIIGKTKYAYDCWSDTVNTASRMESNSFPGCVQVTPAVYERVKHQFDFTLRENIFIKGKGNMNTYYINFEENSTENL